MEADTQTIKMQPRLAKPISQQAIRYISSETFQNAELEAKGQAVETRWQRKR